MIKLPFEMLMETDIEKWRHDTFWVKEPETIEWIKSFKEDALFFDIGANVGLYSLYFACLYPKGLAIAVEPMLVNVETLRHNCGLNKINNIMIEYCAFSDGTAKVPLFVPDLQRGASGTQIIEPKDEKGEPFKQLVRVEDITCYSFDDYRRLFNKKPHNFDRTTYIKIDVDGQETKIIDGITDYSNIEGLLVEFNKGDKQKYIERIQDSGFTIDNKFNQLQDHSRIRRDKEADNVSENVIFTRRRTNGN